MTSDRNGLLTGQDAPHLAQFGLTSEPFAGGSDDPSFFYADANREQRLDLMQHLAPYSEVLLVIGAPGSGKTMLLRQFAARAGETWRVVTVSAEAGMTREEFMARTMEGFGLPVDESTPLEDSRTVLVNHLHGLRQSARMPILIVDDAHHFDPDVMELLLSLCEENDNGHLISMMLFGTPQLQSTLAEPVLAPLQARVAHTFDVPPFSEHDTGRYLRHRMRAAGAADEGPFTPEVVAKIHGATGGMPFAINEMAHYILTQKSAAGGAGAGRVAAPQADAGVTEPGKPNGGLDKRWIAAAVAGLAIVGVLIAGRFTGNGAPGEETAALPLPPSATEESRVLRDGAATSPSSTEAPPPNVAPPTAAAGADLAPPLTALTQKPAPPAPAEKAPAAAPARPAGAEPPPSASPPRKPVVTAGLSAPAQGAEWVRSQPPGNFTLQLMALKDEQALRRILERHKLDNAASFAIQRDGQTLHVLVYGSYSSRETAARAGGELPAGLVSGKPWVRSFKSLQNELNK